MNITDGGDLLNLTKFLCIKPSMFKPSAKKVKFLTVMNWRICKPFKIQNYSQNTNIFFLRIL